MSVWPYLRLPTNARIFVAPLLAPYISETTVTQWANSALGLKTYPIIGPNVVQAVITPTTTIEWASRFAFPSLIILFGINMEQGAEATQWHLLSEAQGCHPRQSICNMKATSPSEITRPIDWLHRSMLELTMCA